MSKLFIRRYAGQGDIDTLIASGMHLEAGNPYHVDNCRWGLIIDAADYSSTFQTARDNGIVAVPGMRIGGVSSGNGQVERGLTREYWDELMPALWNCIREMGSTREIMFDIESYSPTNSAEWIWDSMTFEQQQQLVDASAEFMRIVSIHLVHPKFHPSTYTSDGVIALGKLLLDASKGVGTVQSEHAVFTLHNYVKNQSAYERDVVNRCQHSAKWRQLYPDVNVSHWSDETPLRKIMQPFVSRLDDGEEVWIFDKHRDPDSRNHFATRDHYEYNLFSSHDNLQHVYQFQSNDVNDRVDRSKKFSLGTSISLTGGWPSHRVTVREGKFGQYAAYNPDLIDGSGSIIQALVLPENETPQPPWSYVVEFAIDPFQYGSDGLNRV